MLQDLEFVFRDKLIHSLNIKNTYHYPSNLFSFKLLDKSIYNGKVYNLEVEDDNSYTVNDIAVHNCDALIYMVRTMSFIRNPYPYGYDAKLRPADTFVYNPENYCSGSQNQLNVFKKMFNIKNKR